MLDLGLGGTPSSPELGLSPMIGVSGGGGGGGGQGTKRTKSIEGEGKTEEDLYDKNL